MKKMIVAIVVLLNGTLLPAQGLSNIFSQSAADIKYLLKQIALLQVYIGDVEKGYKIAREGLNFISEIKKGEFNLHSLFFSSLKTVNPSIGKYAKIAAIIAEQQAIETVFDKSFKQCSKSNQFTASELSYLNSVYSRLMDECSHNLDELLAVTSNGVLEMTDDERIKRIDIIYADMKDKWAFAQSFTQDAAILAAERGEETNEINFLKTLE